jgi:hypothetical protein
VRKDNAIRPCFITRNPTPTPLSSFRPQARLAKSLADGSCSRSTKQSKCKDMPQRSTCISKTDIYRFLFIAFLEVLLDLLFTTCLELRLDLSFLTFLQFPLYPSFLTCLEVRLDLFCFTLSSSYLGFFTPYLPLSQLGPMEDLNTFLGLQLHYKIRN